MTQMTEAQTLLKRIFRELMKHSQNDSCYSCKKLIKDLGDFYHIDVSKVPE